VAVLHLEAINNAYLVPKEHPRPNDVRLRLDEVIREAVPRRAAALLGKVLEDDDPAIWLIKRLDLELFLDVGQAEDSAIAHTWSDRVAAGIARKLALGPDGENVLCFSTGEEYLATFLGEAIRGRAWDRWYFTSLETLASLPLGALIASVLERQDVDALVIFDCLVLEGLGPRAISALSSRQSASLVQRLLKTVPRRPRRAGAQALEALRSASLSTLGDSSPEQTVLRLYATTRLANPGLELAGARDLLALSLILAGIIRVATVHRGSPILRLLIHGMVDDAGILVREAVPELRIAGDLIQTVERAYAKELGETVRRAMSEAVTEPAPVQALRSRFGAAFLLIPHLLELGLDDVQANATLRLLVLLKCLGREHADYAIDDEAIRVAAGARKLAPVDSLDPVQLNASLLESLGRLQRLESEWLAIDFAGPIAVVRDPSVGEWVAIGPRGTIRGKHFKPRHLRRPSPVDREMFQALLRPVEADVEHFSLPDNAIGALSAELDQTISLIAAATLRGLAQNLRGFESSSLTYLATNFLIGDCEVIDGPEITVSMAHIPLQMILRRSGIANRPFRVPWLDGRTVAPMLV
jgi:hypothetical protein